MQPLHSSWAIFLHSFLECFSMPLAHFSILWLPLHSARSDNLLTNHWIFSRQIDREVCSARTSLHQALVDYSLQSDLPSTKCVLIIQPPSRSFSPLLELLLLPLEGSRLGCYFREKVIAWCQMCRVYQHPVPHITVIMGRNQTTIPCLSSFSS